MEVGTGGIKVELGSPELSKEFDLSYAKAKLSAGAAIAGELKPKGKAGGSVSVSEGGAKATVTVYEREAKAAGKSKFAQMAHAELETSGWTIDKVDWDVGKLGVGENEAGGGEASVATGVKIIFVNGHEATVEATLFKKSATSGLEGPGLSVEPVLKFPEVTMWENKDAQLTFGGEVKFKMSLSPNWTKIFAELAKKGGRVVARNFARAAMQGMVNFFLGAGGFILGGVITVAATAAEIARGQEIKALIKSAQSAVDTYTRGYCVAWGITEFGFGGAESWYNEGNAAGKAKLNDMIGKIQQHPVFAPYNFTEAELRGAIRARLGKQGSAVWSQVHGEIQTKIYTEYVVQFYRKLEAEYLTTEHMAYKDARLVAMTLGIDESVIPRPK